MNEKIAIHKSSKANLRKLFLVQKSYFPILKSNFFIYLEYTKFI